MTPNPSLYRILPSKYVHIFFIQRCSSCTCTTFQLKVGSCHSNQPRSWNKRSQLVCSVAENRSHRAEPAPSTPELRSNLHDANVCTAVWLRTEATRVHFAHAHSHRQQSVSVESAEKAYKKLTDATKGSESAAASNNDTSEAPLFRGRCKHGY